MSVAGAAWALLARAWAGWNHDNAPRLGAALAYYTLFSLAPLLIIVIAIAGLVFGQEAAQGHIVSEMRGLLGEAGATALEDVVEHSRKAQGGLLATALATLTLFLGASGALVELKGALNQVWDVDASHRRTGIRGLILDRLTSFAMVLVVGFLLLVSLLASATLAASGGVLARYLPHIGALAQAASGLSSFAMTTALFALMFKFLPDRPIPWKDVWAGAAVTSLLFSVGRQVIGLYLGRSSLGSIYGAAGSIVVLVVWVYYAAQIFLFGAELTQAWSGRPRAHEAAQAACSTVT
ncbi:MAG TPA: YihY/virulence factor BrkB family protein [Vicinamibacteria bacterium]